MKFFRTPYFVLLFLIRFLVYLYRRFRRRLIRHLSLLGSMCNRLMVRGQLLFHLLPQRVLTKGGKRLFPRLLVLRNPIRKEVLKVPRSLGLVNRLLPPCMLLTPPLGEEQFQFSFLFLFLLFQWEGDLPSFYIIGRSSPQMYGFCQ